MASKCIFLFPNIISLWLDSFTSFTKIPLSINLLLHILTSILLVSAIKFMFSTLRKPSTMSTYAPLPPGPTPWPIVGCLPKLLLNKPAPRWILSLMREMHTEIACIRLGNVHVMSVTSPELAREFLKTNDALYASRPLSMAAEYMTRGYLTTTLMPVGNQWKKMKRVLTSEVLTLARLEWLLEKRNKEAKNLLFFLYNQCISANSIEGGAVVDLRLATRHYAANVVRQMIFGKRYFGEGRQDGGPGVEEIQHVDTIFESISLVYTFCIADYLPYLRWFDFEGHEKMMKKAMKTLDKYHDPLIEKRIQHHRDMKSEMAMERKEPRDLLDVFILLEADGKPLLSTEEIKAQVTELFYISIDNASNASEWAVAEMTNQPDVLRKAVEELDAVVGKDRLVQESDCPKLNFVKACAREAMRLHPLATFIPTHMATSDGIVGGYSIPKGSHVMLSRYGIGRNPRIWDEPLKFMPERHLKIENNGSFANVDLTQPDLTYISFSTGRRGCPAVPLGSELTIMLLATLLQGFDWSAPPNDQPLIDLSECADSHSMAKPFAHAKPRLPPHIYTSVKM
ncbi:hypothetical protein MKW94_013978 [Papaver nudicaule]|uniref:Cytochrome P450 n=1 Tax=Papaver nudicaule TaxID=74823 RepID=A0AA41VHI9_PAPNU|nr:hypothetical protein [Papaver nudicaule]